MWNSLQDRFSLIISSSKLKSGIPLDKRDMWLLPVHTIEVQLVHYWFTTLPSILHSWMFKNGSMRLETMRSHILSLCLLGINLILSICDKSKQKMQRSLRNRMVLRLLKHQRWIHRISSWHSKGSSQVKKLNISCLKELIEVFF